MASYNSGEQFINKLYNNLINSSEVKRAVRKSDSKISNREDILKAYFYRLEKAHDITKDRKLELLKYFYYEKYLIKELPEDYVELQKRVARERGYGDINVTEEMKEKMLEEVRKEQKTSLDSWISYLTNKDAMYPMWFKYYAFQGMIKLGKFDKEKGKFTKRTSSTVTPFIECNPEILGQMYNILQKTINKQELSENEIEALSKGESFNKLYKYFYVGNYKENINLEETRGIWIKYDQGDNYKPLWESLQGKNTGWCTAGEETCKTQVENGDFYVYYTYDKEGKPVNPRIAIRMDGQDTIGEIRGIGYEQNLEPEMLPILNEKLNEFPDKDKYLKKEHDMLFLTKIDVKTQKGEELNKEELKFLYEIGGFIEGFGWQRDPRIKEIKIKRNNKKDIAKVFDIKEDEVGTKKIDLESGKIKVYIGESLLVDANNISRLQNVIYIEEKNFFLLTSTKGLENLESIGCSADFRNSKDSIGLKKLRTIAGTANFSLISSAEGLENLESIGGTANFSCLGSARGLKNLQSIGGNAIFFCLSSAKGLGKLLFIGGDAGFYILRNLKGLNSRLVINGNAYFSDKITIDDIISSGITINGNIYIGDKLVDKNEIKPKSL